EDDLIPISALQHAMFCERQYALIHLEGIWEDNRFTAEGEALHERVHAEHHESRKRFRQEYDMAVRSLERGLTGKCDLVELWFSADGGIEKASPVEFKRGRKKQSDVDRVQLCAQALCLEEMLGVKIDSGQFYYLQERRRSETSLDDGLRQKTAALIERIRVLWEDGSTPTAEYEKRKCDSCSLGDMCMPKTAGAGAKGVKRYVEAQVRLSRNA
ncbi:MAG: CRISPR-associated protein Cas4, partial [Spirochaetia bacterium]|nr:CRISPR-associated protein Cas4 [Spirochaetia bacterium]